MHGKQGLNVIRLILEFDLSRDWPDCVGHS